MSGIAGQAVQFESNDYLDGTLFDIESGAGYTIGEVIGLSVNRKRGKGLATIAGIAVPISYLFSLWFISFLFGVFFYQVLPLGLFSILYNLLALGLGIWVTITRLR